MNLMTLPTGQAVVIRAASIGVRAPDGARMSVRRRMPIRAVATSRFARDLETGVLRREFVLLDPPLIPGVTRVWVTARAGGDVERAMPER
jgi:hypothetical protein